MTAGARRVAASSIVLLAENVLRLVIVVGVSFWIVKHLGPAQFGILNFASTFLAILLSLAALGMETPVILKLTRSTRPGTVVGTVLSMRALTGLFVFAGGIGLAYALRGDDSLAFNATAIACLAIFAYTPNVFDFWFKARTSAVGPAMARVAAVLGGAVAKVVCVMLGLGVLAFAWTVVLEAVLAGLFLTLAYRWSSKASATDRLLVDRRLALPLVMRSRSYLVSGMAVVLYMKLDVIMLGYMATNRETGIYGLAQKLSEILYVVPVVLTESAFPLLARKFSDDGVAGARHGQMLFDVAVAGSVIATAIALVLSKPLINMVFGAAYDEAVNIFYIHAWSTVAIAMNVARHNWLAVVNLQRYAPLVTGIGLVSNVLMNLLLIPRFGALGAAIATVVSYFLSGYVASFMFRPLHEIGRMQTRALWPWHRFYRQVAGSRGQVVSRA